ncbi:AAA domain containing protein, partial [uncultured Caudovirales phage]
MSMLGSVVSGPAMTGQRIVIAGAEKVGKTTLACDAPNSLLVPLEIGYASIRTPRIPQMLTTWEEVENLCIELLQAAQAGRIARGSSIVWDSATALERIIHAKIISLDAAWKPGNPNG